MGKLVLLLGDGTTRDIPLRRERITLGRRPDNDICLPHPAVSGEHAAVTTILSDSFLEDLGSTNGTLVNGERVTKHVLRDADVIDVGRQRLVYLADENADVPDALRMRIEPAATLQPAREDRTITMMIDAPAVARAPHTTTFRAVSWPEPPEPAAQGVGVIVDEVAMHGATIRHSHQEPRPELVVLTGPRAGRSLALVKEVTSVGRAGVQVALVRRTPEGYVVVPAEGSAPPELNGAPLAETGALLGPGDVIEVAGSRIEFCPAPDLPT